MATAQQHASTDPKGTGAGPETHDSKQPGTEAGGDERNPEQQRDDQRDTDTDEPHGADALTQDVLTNARSFAAEARTLDAASHAFGLQTNQQINLFGLARAEGAHTPTPLSAETLARVRKTFVLPSDYTALRSQLMDGNLVILSGRPGSGRQHVATHILDALCDGHVDHLTGGALADLDVSIVADDAGYLWTGVAESTPGPVDAAHVERLVEALRARHANMIVIWPDSARWPHELAHHRYALEHPLDLSAVLRMHMHPDADELDAAATDLLCVPAVVEAQAKLAGAGEAAQLGRALNDVLLGRSTLHEALSKAEATADWFARLPEREDRAFAVALSALNGLSYVTVVAGARRMDELIQQAEDPKRRSFIRALDRPTRPMLEAVDAATKPGMLATSYGEVPIVAVSSNRNDFARDMLRTLWQEFPYLPEIYLDWLAELVESPDLVANPDPHVRDRAAVVIGLLAQHDFDFVSSRILSGWACSDKREVRRAAGVALRAPALSDELSSLVWKMLDEWAGADGLVGSDQHNRRMTAATALGGPVGATDCGRALDIITKRLLDWEPGHYSYRLWAATMTAVGDLFGDGGSTQSTTVLERMTEWAGDDKRLGARTVAVAALVGIATRPPIAGYHDDHRLAPILRAITTDPKNRDRIAGLWRIALNDRVMAETSVAALLRLSEHVDDNGGEDLLIELVRVFPKTERERRTLRYEIRQRTAENPHPPILDRLLNLLNSLEVTG